MLGPLSLTWKPWFLQEGEPSPSCAPLTTQTGRPDSVPARTARPTEQGPIPTQRTRPPGIHTHSQRQTFRTQRGASPVPTKGPPSPSPHGEGDLPPTCKGGSRLPTEEAPHPRITEQGAPSRSERTGLRRGKCQSHLV